MTTDTARRKTAGWPALLRDVQDMRVRTTRELRNGYCIVPAGTVGTLRTAGNGWDLLEFTGDRCTCCGIQPRINRTSWNSYTIEPQEPGV